MIKKTISQIIPNTVMFLLVVGFMAVFTGIFNTANALVGVGIIVVALVGMGKNLTITPVRDFLLLLVTCVGLGACVTLAQENLWLGIPLNFIALFFIGYVMSSDLTKTMVVPFGLLYLFMLYMPVTGQLLTLRFAALACGAVFVMLLQFVVGASKKLPLKRHLISARLRLKSLMSSQAHKIRSTFTQITLPSTPKNIKLSRGERFL